MTEPAPLRERMVLLVGLGATLGLLATSFGQLWGSSGVLVAEAELGMVVGLGLAAVAAGYAVVRDQVEIRIGLGALAGLMPLIYVLAQTLGWSLDDYPQLSSSPMVEGLGALVCTLGSIGLVARRSWARWIALAAALSGIGTGGLNLMGHWGETSLEAWVYALAVVFSMIVLLALIGSSVRSSFEAEGEDGVWASREPAVRAVRWTVLSQLVAIPMLLIYALTQPVVPAMRVPALILALILGGAALLSMARKLAGPVLLVLGGPALLVLTAVAAWHAEAMDPRTLAIVSYYACFWIPAGLISMVAGCVLARPVMRLWTRLD